MSSKHPSGKEQNNSEKTTAKDAWDSIFNEIISPEMQATEFKLGPMHTHSMLTDPKHCCFALSRYKFVAKMLDGRNRILEIGCGDCFGTPIVAQHVNQVHCIDWDDRFITDNRERLKLLNNISFEVHDINKSPMQTQFEAAYCVDVIEHLEPDDEAQFMENACQSITAEGTFIIGTPNITACQYASPQSNAAHINLHNHESLKKLMGRYFYNTFMLSMNDEVLHTGFSPMAHYIWAIGAGLRTEYRKTF